VPAALKLDYSTMDDGDAQSMIRVEPCKQPGDRAAGPRGTGGASSYVKHYICLMNHASVSVACMR